MSHIRWVISERIANEHHGLIRCAQSPEIIPGLRFHATQFPESG
jgi:hypothetical protein